MCRQYPFSEQKQWEAKVKVKETDPTCSQIWPFPVALKWAILFHLRVNTNWGYETILFLWDGCRGWGRDSPQQNVDV